MLDKKLFLLLNIFMVLFFCGTASAIVISENPDIDGSKVVYEQNDTITNQRSIYWKDLSTGDVGRVSDYTGPNYEEEPAISGNIVVWEDYREGRSAIYYKNLSNGQGGRVSSYHSSTLAQTDPSIDGTIVVWEDNREGKDAIYWKDILKGNGGRVSSYYGANQFNPSISGTKVVWQDYRENFANPIIYWKDILKGNGGRVSSYYRNDGPNGVLNQYSPSISGNRVVWSDNRDDPNPYDQTRINVIYWRDILSGNGGRLSTYNGPNLVQLVPRISDNRVVWEDLREGDAVIYWKDIATGAGGRVSSYFGSNLDQQNPEISGTRVVWQDYRESTRYIKTTIYWKDLQTGEGGRVPPQLITYTSTQIITKATNVIYH